MKESKMINPYNGNYHRYIQKYYIKGRKVLLILSCGHSKYISLEGFKKYHLNKENTTLCLECSR